jgi:hypothetical protein
MKKEQLKKLLKLKDIKQILNKKNPKKKKISNNLNKELKNFVPKINYEARASGVSLFT